MLVLYSFGPTVRFDLGDQRLSDPDEQRIMSTAARLLETRKDYAAAETLREGIFHLRSAFTVLFDNFSVLHASVSFDDYERLRAQAETTGGNSRYKAAAGVLRELGYDVRWVVLELDLDARPPRTESERQRCLTVAEINTLVYAYIGVDHGYLGLDPVLWTRAYG